jgi:hypothetical protein
MLPIGSYLVFGPTSAPAVHLLSADEHKAYQQRYSIALKHGSARVWREVYRLVFNQPEATVALPAYSLDCMLDTAQNYQGPFQVEVRGIAAAIALGKPFAKDQGENPAPGPSDDGGGPKVPRKPLPKGKPPSALANLLQQTG